MPMCDTAGHRFRALWFLTVLVACVIAYASGLDGPFLFDDPPNLVRPLSAWLEGQTGWQEIVWGNGSGLLGRPLAMLTFLTNAAVSGLDAMPFKATNLAIHLLCGVLIFRLLLRLLPRDPLFKDHAFPVAFLIAGIWLLHPMQVSTVLYTVQRMAQLSAFFMISGMLAYVWGRQCIEQGRRKAGWIALFALVPLATVAAMFSKENGALLPLLCAVIELGYFCTRPRPVRLFFGLLLLLPGVAATAWYALHPQRIMAGYEGRTFRFGERLLSEPRAIVEYMSALAFPQGSSLGLYTDDFAVSHGLIDPPMTLIAIVMLIGIWAAAIALRSRIPALFTGLGLFLAGHAMESTVFPLELYFEHRNYLPSAGFFLALVGVTGYVVVTILPRTDAPERVMRSIRMGGVALLVALGAATLVRAQTWSSWQLLAAQGMREHPESLRAHLDQVHLLQVQGDIAGVEYTLDQMSRIDRPAARHVAAIDRLALHCMAYREASSDDVEKVRDVTGSRLELAEMLAFENLAGFLIEHECNGLGRGQLADILVDIVNGTDQASRLTPIWRTRFNAARLYAKVGRLNDAQTQAALAWMTGYADPAVGVFLVQVFQARGDLPSARLVLEDVRPHIASWDRRGQRRIAILTRELGLNIRPEMIGHGHAATTADSSEAGFETD